MTLDLTVWISVALFLVHEFEEIIFIRAWIDRHQDDPRVSRQVFWSFRDTSTATIAALIFEEYLLFTVVAFLTTTTSLGGMFFAGLLAPYALHLVGHIAEAVSLKMRTPSVTTSALTLPWYAYAIAHLTSLTPDGIPSLIAWSLFFTAIIAANFALLYRVRPHLDRHLHARSKRTRRPTT